VVLILNKIYVKAEDITPVNCEKEFQETAITFLRGDSHIEIFTSDNTFITKLKKLLEQNPDTYSCWEGNRDSEGNITSYWFSAPMRALSLRSGKSKEMSDEQRLKASERFKDMWKNKNNS
jgi:hypothetical protein